MDNSLYYIKNSALFVLVVFTLGLTCAILLNMLMGKLKKLWM